MARLARQLHPTAISRCHLALRVVKAIQEIPPAPALPETNISAAPSAHLRVCHGMEEY
jgi:hypothetical protein